MGHVTLHRSAAAATRLAAAHRFLDALSPATEALVVGATREAVDDLVREQSVRRGATFGLHRFSLRQLAVRVTATQLAARGLAPSTRLGAEAVAARAAFDELEQGTLSYVSPIARLRSFGRTLASTLDELRFGDVDTDRLDQCGAVGGDLELLSARYTQHLEQARLIDIPELYRLAASIIASTTNAHPAGTRETDSAGGLRLDVPVVLVDVPVHDEATRTLVRALAGRANRFLATVPAGDDRTLGALNGWSTLTDSDETTSSDSGPLARVRRRLFAPIAPVESVPDEGDRSGDGRPDQRDEPAVSLFSAPGETRECVEIARSVHEQARRGIPLDRMAVVLRAPQIYAALLETALRRAGVEAWFVRGTRAPDPAGRAFLALLACAAERLSARRFSEYLSLGQVPRPDHAGAPPLDRGRWVPPDDSDQLLPGPAQPEQPSLFDPPASAPIEDGDRQPVVDGTLRTPWRWDRLLVESAVIGGHDRWARRLTGLERELELRLQSRQREDPHSSRVSRLESDLINLGHLRRFALPVIDRLGRFPDEATWGEWLDRLDVLAPMVLERPDRVLAVLGELRPMAAVGPVPLAEVQNVLAERLTQLQEEPPSRRYGRVFVGAPEHVRGRVFDVVFVPGLAERVFPQKQRQDPLLLDDHRRALNHAASPSPVSGDDIPGERVGLRLLDDRAAHERLLLRLAVGAATRQLYLSYPRLQLGDSRPRVPSFYALDLERARTGHVPDFAMTERQAFARVGARLAWPAPPDPALAIDDTEHDLSVLGPLLRRRMSPDLTGRARYLLQLNRGLRRSLLTRWARWMPAWTKYDGIYRPRPAGARRARPAPIVGSALLGVGPPTVRHVSVSVSAVHHLPVAPA